MIEIQPARIDAIGPHLEWLGRQLRLMRCRLYTHPAYAFAACRCSDLDGGRPTEGFAARPGVPEAVRHAAEEAILAWRNIVALEHSAMRFDGLADDDRAAVERYRGALPARSWAPPEIGPYDIADANRPPDLDALIGIVARRTGRRVRLFDMTDDVLRLPVVKAHLG